MIYLIGGAPRLGKTTLVNSMVQKHPMHAVSTDAIRYMLRRAVPREALDPDLFLHFGTDIIPLWDQDHTQTLEEQNRQSRALWPAITEFIKSYDEDGVDLIVEGIAVIPEFSTRLDVPHKTLCIGNTSSAHPQKIIEIARQNSHDWMHTMSDDDIAKACAFFGMYSEWVRQECVEKDIEYAEISDDDFVNSLERAVARLLKN